MDNVPRILAVKLSSLGDLFHALPAVHVVRAAWNARVDWVTQPEYAALAACFTDVDRVLSFPRRGFFRQARSFVGALRARRYDLILDFQGLLKSALTARLARGGRIIGPTDRREGAGLFYHETAGGPPEPCHAVERALALPRHLGLATEGEPVFPVTFPPADAPAGRPRVGLIPCSRWPSKNWPPEHFAHVGRRLIEERGASLFLFGGPGDAGACAVIEGALEGFCRNLAGRTVLPELGGWLGAMDLVLSVDSGPMHMAAAAGTPVLALFGPTDPRRTGPYGRGHRVLRSEQTSCWPCRNRTCGRCIRALAALSPERVAEQALDLLENAAHTGDNHAP